MTALEVKWGIIVLLVIAMGTMVWHVTTKLNAYDAIVADNTTLTQRVGELEKKDAAYDQAIADKAVRDNATRDHRAVVTSNLTKAASNDPTVADFLNAPIPVSVRAAFAPDSPAVAGSTNGAAHGNTH